MYGRQVFGKYPAVDGLGQYPIYSSGQAGCLFLWLLSGLLLCGFLFLASAREALLLRPIMRARLGS